MTEIHIKTLIEFIKDKGCHTSSVPCHTCAFGDSPRSKNSKLCYCSIIDDPTCKGYTREDKEVREKVTKLSKNLLTKEIFKDIL